jgi:hypothetical protein
MDKIVRLRFGEPDDHRVVDTVAQATGVRNPAATGV